MLAIMKLERSVMAVVLATTLALGLAARNAIFEAAGLMCDIRWPNDLLLSGKKVAGILVQAADWKAVGGNGNNVGHGEFPAELAGVAVVPAPVGLAAPGTVTVVNVILVGRVNMVASGVHGLQV